MRLFDRSLITVWLLNLYDTAITVYADGLDGFDELNLVMRACLDAGVGVFIVVKVIVMTIACLSLRRRFKLNHQRTIWSVLIAILALYAVTCAWNTYVVLVLLSG